MKKIFVEYNFLYIFYMLLNSMLNITEFKYFILDLCIQKTLIKFLFILLKYKN